MAKNCTLVEDLNKAVLVSYATPVAVFNKNEGRFYVTEEKFSTTTTKHINGWLGTWGIQKQKAFNVIKVPQSEIVKMACGLSVTNF